MTQTNIIFSTDAEFATTIATVHCQSNDPPIMLDQADLIGGQLANIYCSPVYSRIESLALPSDDKNHTHRPSYEHQFPINKSVAYNVCDDYACFDRYSRAYIVTVIHRRESLSILVSAESETKAYMCAGKYLERNDIRQFFVPEKKLKQIESGKDKTEIVYLTESCFGYEMVAIEEQNISAVLVY